MENKFWFLNVYTSTVNTDCQFGTDVILRALVNSSKLHWSLCFLVEIQRERRRQVGYDKLLFFEKEKLFFFSLSMLGCAQHLPEETYWSDVASRFHHNLKINNNSSNMIYNQKTDSDFDSDFAISKISASPPQMGIHWFPKSFHWWAETSTTTTQGNYYYPRIQLGIYVHRVYMDLQRTRYRKLGFPSQQQHNHLSLCL